MDQVDVVESSRLRVGAFFFGGPVVKKGGVHYAGASIWNMLKHFHHFMDIEFICPEVPYREEDAQQYSIDLSTVKLRTFSGWKSGFHLYSRRFPLIVLDIFQTMRHSLGEWNLILIIDTDPLSQVVLALAKAFQMPAAVYIRGNADYEILQRNTGGLRRILASLWCHELNAILPRLLKRSALIVTGSPLLEKYNSVMYVHRFTATPLLKREMPKVSRKRDFGSNALKLLYVGNLVPYKGIDIALRALKELIDRGHSVSLDIVGQGPMEQDLKEMARRLKIDSSSCFHGFVPFGERLFKIYEKSHVFFLPSLSEGTPKVVAEAMGFGLPVIASKVGGLPDLIEEGQTGFLIEPRVIAQFTEKLELLARDRVLLREMSRKCEIGALGFTLDVQIKHLSLYLCKFIHPSHKNGHHTAI